MMETLHHERHAGWTLRPRATAVLLALGFALVVLVVANLCLGSLRIPVVDIWRILSGGPDGSSFSRVIWNIRLPRLAAAGLLGGALALSGLLLQILFNNPIAGPFILGISSASKLAVAVVLVLLVGNLGVMTSWMSMLAAFGGSLVALAFVLAVSRRVSSVSQLVVAGVMVGYLCSAATDLLVSFASDANIVNLRNWSLGSFSGINAGQIQLMAAVVLPTSLCVFLLSKPLAAYQLGEAYAQSVGVNVKAFRTAIIMLSSLLAACVTAFAGPVSFVGIAVPHLARRCLATSKPLVVVPATFLGGAVFCLACDLIARCAFAPTEVAVSTVTALLGAPVVISMLLSRRREVR